MSTQQKIDSGSTVSERKSWPINSYRLGSEPNDDLSAITTPEERLEMMWALSLEAWTLARLPQPQYKRSEIPFLGREALVANKRATGRAKDLADLEILEAGKQRTD